MKRNLFLIPMILATTAALADAQMDAQALLSRPHAVGSTQAEARSLSTSPVSEALDAHESAAALLSGVRRGNRVNAPPAVATSSGTRAPTDAQAQAAALLSGSRVPASKQIQAQR